MGARCTLPATDGSWLGAALGQALGAASPEATQRHPEPVVLGAASPKAPRGRWYCRDMKAWPCLDLGNLHTRQDLELPWEQQGLNSGHKAAPHPLQGCPAGMHPMANSSVPGLLIFYFILESSSFMSSLIAQLVKNLAAMWETPV